ncbi:hypothetical protein AGMMS50229_14030 [Campylobacterota bacterium]|nr:hypothetical protein AGMMS50229_14030 [Campylobacterota bacterium]
MSVKLIQMFDTTLRDGEQAPGAAMSMHEKIGLAKKLEKLGVGVIEAGFARSSKTDFDAIRQIAKCVKDSTICSLARANEKDIESAAEALHDARRSRIHIFLATSDLHLEQKLRMSREQALELAVKSVTKAVKLCDEVQFSFEDASRSDFAFLQQMTRAVVSCGATIVNVPDTVGFLLPSDVKPLFEAVANAADDRAVISAHMHNDLGLACANSLAAIEAGATQVEATINGIGERSGNAALEEIAVIIKTKLSHAYETRIATRLLSIVSDEVARISAMPKAPNKAIVGQNAFSHGSGIHQDGVLKRTDTYESFSADLVGAKAARIILTRHSGGSAIRRVLHENAIAVDDFDSFYAIFKRQAEANKIISSEMLKNMALI